MLKDLIELEKTAIAVGSVSLEASQLRALWNYIQRTGDETPEKPDVNDVFRAGVTQAKYRYHYKAALEEIAGYQGDDSELDINAANMRRCAREALDSSPEESSEKTGREPAFDPDVRVLSSEEVARGLTLNNIATFAYPPWHRKRYCDSGLRLMGISDTRTKEP
jgi:hypothetical protein